MTPGLHVLQVRPSEMPAHRAAWHDLLGRCLERSVFNEPAFALAAAAHLGPPRGLRYLTVWSADATELLGLCALAAGGRPGAFRSASAWSHPQATSAFPVLDRDRGEAVLPALLKAIGDLPGGPVAVRLEGVPVDGPTAQLLRRLDPALRPLETRSRAVLLPGSGSTSRSAKARKEARRQWKRLSEQGALAFGSDRSAETMSAALDRFLALEARSWKGRRGTALRDGRGREAFVRAAVAGLAERGQCRIDLLTLEGRPIAAGIVLRSGDRAYYWKTAYDEALARFSPGVQFTLRLTEVQHAESGLAVTDSCAIPGHSMIDRVWPDRIEVADYLIATRPSSPMWFAAARASEMGRRRVRQVAKRLRDAVARRGRIIAKL